MGANTRIEWADDTFNPWVGCTKFSSACDHCYAQGWAKRAGEPELWRGERRLTSTANWRQPRKWNREAAATGVRKRVFCASLADVFDNQVPDEWRLWLWELIDECQALDWLLLTKRPQNIAGMLPLDWGAGWSNVWLGTTVENQEEADRRIPRLLATPARVRFLSCEPLLAPVDLSFVPWTDSLKERFAREDDLSDGFDPLRHTKGGHLDWIICGGENGPGARPMHPDWARSLRDQCSAAGVPFFFKQWGAWRQATDDEIPERFGDACNDFRVMCSNGFVGDLAIGSAFLHRPRSWPGCFPQGDEADAVCSSVIMRRVGKKAAGRLLDGREHNEIPAEPANA